MARAEEFEPTAEDFCHGAEDVAEAALFHIVWMGRYAAKERRVDEEEARRIGEQAMGRKASSWASDWLLPLSEKSPSSILFSTVDGKRVGVNMIVPLKEAGWRRFRAGKAYDLDLRMDEIETPSKFLLILAAAEAHPRRFRSAARASQEQIIRLSWQLASLCTDVTKLQERPVLVSIQGTPESKRRLEGLGFSLLGKKMPVDPRPLWELSPTSSQRSFRSRLNYHALCGLIEAFQAKQRQATADGHEV